MSDHQIQLTGTSVPSSDGEDKKPARRSFVLVVGAFLGLCKDYTAEDIGRLKEAGVQLVEGKARTANAEATKIVAEAARLQGEEEDLRATARAKDSAKDANTLKTVVDAGTKFESHEQDMIDRKMSRVIAAMEAIKQAGGNTALLEEQLVALLARGCREFPYDKHLRSIQLPEPVSDENGDS